MNVDIENVNVSAEVEEIFKKLFKFVKKFEKLPFIAENFNWYIEPFFVQQNILAPLAFNLKYLDELIYLNGQNNILNNGEV